MNNDKTIADAQRERYQRPLREQIEGLIKEFEAIDGDFYNYGWDGAVDQMTSRLRAILDEEVAK